MPQEPHRDEGLSAKPYFSPGLVHTDEIILRTVPDLDPDHLGPNGTLANAAIALKDIRFRGWSVDRKHYTSLWRIWWFHFNWKRRKPKIRGFYVLPIPVNNMRRRDPQSQKQDFVVVDTARWFRPAHADVLLSEEKSEGDARLLRNNLVQSLPPYTNLSCAFGATDKWGFARGMSKQLLAMFLMPFRWFRNRFKPSIEPAED